MTQDDDRGRREDPTFVDVLEHIGSGGVSVYRSGPRTQPREEFRSYAGSGEPRRRSSHEQAHPRRRHKP